MNNDLENKIEKKIFDFAKSIMVSFTNEEQEILIEVGDNAEYPWLVMSMV